MVLMFYTVFLECTSWLIEGMQWNYLSARIHNAIVGALKTQQRLALVFPS